VRTVRQMGTMPEGIPDGRYGAMTFPDKIYINVNIRLKNYKYVN